MGIKDIFQLSKLEKIMAFCMKLFLLAAYIVCWKHLTASSVIEQLHNVSKPIEMAPTDNTIQQVNATRQPSLSTCMYHWLKFLGFV